MQVQVLRHFRIVSNGSVVEVGHAGERLVAYLALEDHTRTRNQVAGALWPEAAQYQAAASLRRALSIVRRLAPDLIRREANRLSLQSWVSVDAQAQRHLIDAITTGQRDSADGVELRLLGGDLLPDWDEYWLAAAREELRLLRLLSLEAVAAAHVAACRHAAGLNAALLVAREEPLRESAHRLVIQAHLAQGNQAQAAQQYLRYRGLLWDDLRLLPSPDLQALAEPLVREAARRTRPSRAGVPLTSR
ncbi:BTAD domain-containing putative transcriptional regulator [Actinopolymorpha sp. NPDC004070]|uniref:AfsR/SARP family transcriptional regulator n=1 Tax=Actinopolymorpha sp. NPDC004070 TaxID=3154548 RepID=UPI0033B3EBD0